MVVGSTAAGNSACPDTRGRVVQLHRATLPARIVRSACLAAVAAVALGAHRVATASVTLGMRDISPYSASPFRSAARVLTQGMPRLRSAADRPSTTDRPRAKARQVTS